jgi:hypothetical protein
MGQHNRCCDWAMGWMTEEFGFNSRTQGKDFSLLHNLQTGSDAHPASYTVGTGASFPEGYSSRSEKPTTHLHLVLRLRMVTLYLHTPICLHGLVFNYLSPGKLYFLCGCFLFHCRESCMEVTSCYKLSMSVSGQYST